MKAATRFGMSWSAFLREPMERRCEMAAFVIAEGTMAGYENEQWKIWRKVRAGRGGSATGHSGGVGSAAGGSYYNPLAAQRARMGLPPL
jgi:hypothetical protein